MLYVCQLSTVNSFCILLNAKWTKRIIPLVLLLIFQLSILSFQTCGFDVEDPTQPSKPQWVQKSLPEVWPERGVDAHESAGIYLEWESNTEDELVAYNIYRAQMSEVNDSLSDFELAVRLDIELVSDRKYVDREVEFRIQYSYKIKSENASGDLSVFSDPSSYSLLPRIHAVSMIPNGLTTHLGNNRNFSWEYLYAIEMENYSITILSENDELIVREVILPNNYIDGKEYWLLPEEITLDPERAYKWRIDIGAKYIGGYETAGSESAWAPFIYSGKRKK
jgi:hypothetical protein